MFPIILLPNKKAAVHIGHIGGVFCGFPIILLPNKKAAMVLI